jgi:anaphase-promoting complex subunit 6
VSCLVELNQRHNLFYLAHKLVDDSPKLPISWYAVGSYYLLVKEYIEARRYFAKAWEMDRNFGAAWLGFATAFAQEDEHEQAITAYCAAGKLMKGRHEPQMYAGMQYFRQGNFAMAKKFLEAAREICPDNPSLENEIGCYWFKVGEYEKAKDFFLNVLRLGKGIYMGFHVADMDMSNEQWVETWINLGHVYRKIGY